VGEPAVAPRDALALFRASEGAITGTVVCAAAIAAGAGHIKTTAELSLVILGTVAVYWIAHLHAETIGSALTHRHHPLAAIRHAFWETLPIAAASVVPLGVLLLTTLFGADLKTAAWTAMYASVALLAIYSYIAGARGGLDISGRLASAAAGGAVGVLVVLLKAGLH
jgi:hypothetical protein